MKQFKQKIDHMLKAFGYPESTFDDAIIYFCNGFSLMEEDREFKYKTLRGWQSEMKPHYVLLVETIEYNYPDEPDFVDVAEVGEFLDVLSAVEEMIKQDTNAKIERYLEHLGEVEMEEHYAEIM